MDGRNEYNGKKIDPMWDFLFKFGQKSNVKQLMQDCESFRRAFLQKTGGQKEYRKSGDVDFADINMLINSIVVEAYVLWANGDLDKLEGKNE